MKNKIEEELSPPFVNLTVIVCNILSGMVHTGVEVHRMDSEMSRLVE